MQVGEAYLLFIKVDRDTVLSVGSLGEIKFKKGIYVYVGSGGKNIYKRIGRHFKREKKLRWHIDYLTIIYQPYKAWIIQGKDLDEERLASILIERYPYVKGFGATDSRHPSHLFHLGNDELEELREILQKMGLKITSLDPKNH